MAARNGDLATANQALKSAEKYPHKEVSDANADMRLIAEAEMALARKMPAQAIALLNTRYANDNCLYLLNATLERALRQAGKTNAANSKLEWLVENRGKAYAEFNQQNFLQPANVVTYQQAAARLKNKGLGKPL